MNYELWNGDIIVYIESESELVNLNLYMFWCQEKIENINMFKLFLKFKQTEHT